MAGFLEKFRWIKMETQKSNITKFLGTILVIPSDCGGRMCGWCGRHGVTAGWERGSNDHGLSFLNRFRFCHFNHRFRCGHRCGLSLWNHNGLYDSGCGHVGFRSVTWGRFWVTRWWISWGWFRISWGFGICSFTCVTNVSYITSIPINGISYSLDSPIGQSYMI